MNKPSFKKKFDTQKDFISFFSQNQKASPHCAPLKL